MSGADQTSKLWAITCYFNPVGYKRRLENYEQFRMHFRIPLVTVEIGYADHFELGPDAADVLIQIPGKDILWQKERLLNLALPALPSSCTYVMWTDCDIVFPNYEWITQVGPALERFALLRPFETVRHVTADDAPALPVAAASVGSAKPLPRAALRYPDLPESCEGVPLPSKPWGKAWIAQRELLERCGLYDACVIGGGDLAIALAASGDSDLASDLLRLEGARRDHYQSWASIFRRAVDGRVGTLGCVLKSLLHGSLDDRRYGDRHTAFRAFGFDPTTDIALDANGAWRWNSDKSEMHEFVADYFVSRREDD